MRFTRVTRVYNHTDFDLELRVIVRVVEIPWDLIPVCPGNHAELNYRKYMIKKYNPEMVPSIWVYNSSNRDRPLIDEPITLEELRDFEDIVISGDREFFVIEKCERTFKNRLRYAVCRKYFSCWKIIQS